MFVGEMLANKVLLSLVSDVFRTQFFGELPESSKERYHCILCTAIVGIPIAYNFAG